MTMTISTFFVLLLAITVQATKGFNPSPGTYASPSDAQHTIQISKDHTFKVRTNVRCIRAPCPQSGGTGTWKYQDNSHILSLLQHVAPGWDIQQDWRIQGKDRAGRLGVELVLATGTASREVPMPAGDRAWIPVRGVQRCCL
ncbi:hypothetical protein BC828DRAFT_375502 [Blastocladiella britannica]|nr:hypothetical protein BC828DRAFT_375502 [Blastocladiella britannica]